LNYIIISTKDSSTSWSETKEIPDGNLYLQEERTLKRVNIGFFILSVLKKNFMYFGIYSPYNI
jgi:hypothetical protein